jgi:hypothetical protein
VPCTCARAEHQRQHARNERQRRHQNRTQAVAIALNNGIVAIHAFFAQFVGVVNLQDRVLLHHAKEHQIPSIEKMLIDCPNKASDRIANGTVSGSDSKIVIG